MDKIAMVKKEVQLQNWSDKELARQELGLTVTDVYTAAKWIARARNFNRTLPKKQPHVAAPLTAPEIIRCNINGTLKSVTNDIWRS